MPQGSLSKTQIAAVCGEMIIFVFAGYYALKFIVNVLDPTNKQKTEARKLAEKLMKSIGVKDITLNDYEMVIAANLVDPLSMSMTWGCIGGLNDIVRQMKENVVLPFERREIFSKSVLLSPPKGILLYGPPGCGKTLIAKATAKDAGCRFLNLDVSSLTDKWYGESQKLANAVFSLAYKIQPCIIFIDEIDSFLRSRSSSDHEATAMMKAQFMSLWDGLSSTPKSDIIIMGATNRPSDVDRAILRRMPCRFYVPMPDKEQRVEILKIILEGEKLDANVGFEELAEMTAGCSGSDIKEFCRLAALNSIRGMSENTKFDMIEEPSLCPLSMSDFSDSFGRMQKSHLQLASNGLFD